MKLISIKSLIWDKWNRQHILKHRLTPRKAEQALHDKNKIAQDTHSGRLKLIGQAGKRMLILILSPQGKKYYVVTARDADKKERSLYRTLNQ